MVVTVKDKKDVIERDGGACVLHLGLYCLGGGQTADHRANRGSGGAGAILDGGENLIAACAVCNSVKETATGDMLQLLIVRGCRVLPGATHRKTLARVLLTPVRMPDGMWRMLQSTTAWREATTDEISAHLDWVYS